MIHSQQQHKLAMVCSKVGVLVLSDSVTLYITSVGFSTYRNIIIEYS